MIQILPVHVEKDTIKMVILVQLAQLNVLHVQLATFAKLVLIQKEISTITVLVLLDILILA